MELKRLRIYGADGKSLFIMGECRLEVYENCAFVNWIDEDGTIIDPEPRKKVNVFPLSRISSMECIKAD